MKKQLVLILSSASLFLIYQGCESQEFVSAKMYDQQGELEKAEEFYLKAMELETEQDNAEIPYRLAQLYAKQYRYEEMNLMIEEALKRNPTKRIGQFSIEELVDNLRKIQWSTEYKRGADLYNAVISVTDGASLDEAQREQILKAKAHFETAITVWPQEGSTYQNLVFCYRQLEDAEGERRALKDALKMEPDNGMILLLAGERAWNDGERDQAVEYYEKALEFLPDNIDIMQRLTAAYLESGNAQAALETLEKAQRHTPRDPDVYYNLGAVYANIGNDALERGQNLYRDAVSAEDVPIDKLAIAVDYFKQAQRAYSESLYFMDNTLALNPEDTAATQAIREIQNTKKILDTLQRSAQEFIDQNR